MKHIKRRQKKKEHKFIKTILLIIFITAICFLSPKLLNTENIGFANLSEHIEKENELILVNSENKLPSDYNVELVNFKNNLVANLLLNDLKEMYSDAESQGITLYINSAYRSVKEQERIFNDRVQKYKKMRYNDKESTISAKSEVQEPGYSEHQTGLAIDFSKDYKVNERMWDWLERNAYKYGFILRYPEDKVDITNIIYERWHYRYVGKDVAKIMYSNNLCLEEYLMQK